MNGKDDRARIPRRDFLAGLVAALIVSAAMRPTSSAQQEELHILKSGEPDRWRLDFNGNRQKVRLCALLSPT
jgi:hypothetical protein